MDKVEPTLKKNKKKRTVKGNPGPSTSRSSVAATSSNNIAVIRTPDIDFSMGGYDPTLDDIELQDLYFDDIDKDVLFNDLIISGDYANGPNDLDMYLQENIAENAISLNDIKVEPMSKTVDNLPEKSSPLDVIVNAPSKQIVNQEPAVMPLINDNVQSNQHGPSNNAPS